MRLASRLRPETDPAYFSNGMYFWYSRGTELR
jgi:hypothetical protein